MNTIKRYLAVALVVLVFGCATNPVDTTPAKRGPTDMEAFGERYRQIRETSRSNMTVNRYAEAFGNIRKEMEGE